MYQCVHTHTEDSSGKENRPWIVVISWKVDWGPEEKVSVFSTINMCKPVLLIGVTALRGPWTRARYICAVTTGQLLA
jgi:hypothetical protein